MVAPGTDNSVGAITVTQHLAIGTSNDGNGIFSVESVPNLLEPIVDEHAHQNELTDWILLSPVSGVGKHVD
jgi:hypothetical protein